MKSFRQFVDKKNLLLKEYWGPYHTPTGNELKQKEYLEQEFNKLRELGAQGNITAMVLYDVAATLDTLWTSIGDNEVSATISGETEDVHYGLIQYEVEVSARIIGDEVHVSIDADGEHSTPRDPQESGEKVEDGADLVLQINKNVDPQAWLDEREEAVIDVYDIQDAIENIDFSQGHPDDYL